MADTQDPLPYDFPELRPGDPGYQERLTINRASQENFLYWLKHEAEIFENHGDDIAIIYGGGQLQYCSDPHEAADFLKSLTHAQRSAAHISTYLPADVAWAL